MEQNSGASSAEGWSKLPDDLRSQISFLCSEGEFMICAVCSKFDTPSKSIKGYAKVTSYGGPYCWGRFHEHVQQKKHKGNVIKKATFESINLSLKRKGKKQITRDFADKKQCTLSFALKTPTKTQIVDRIQIDKT